MKRLQYDRVIVITVLVACLSLVTGLLVLSQVKQQLVHISAENYEKQQTLLANQIADSLRSNLANIENQLQLMATIPEVRNTDDPAVCNAKLLELLQVNQRQIGNLGRVGTDGRFACSINTALIGQEASRYGDYIDRLFSDPEHRPVVSRLTRPAGTTSNVVSIHLPVFQDGEFRGSLGAALYFNQFQDSYLGGIRIGDNGYVIVMDDNGDILYHPRTDLSGRNVFDKDVIARFEPQQTIRDMLHTAREGKAGTTHYAIDGTRKMAVYKSFRVPNTMRRWTVVATTPITDVDAAVQRSGIDAIFNTLVVVFTATTAVLAFISLRNVIRNTEIQRAKNEFISITSHQLRTPATIVKQNLGIIRSGFYADKEAMLRFVDAAYESNENQLAIIENILHVSRLEAGRLDIRKETVDLRQLIKDVTDSMRLSATARRQRIRVRRSKHPIAIQADPTKLSMAIENLISNAIKYTADGGRITVSLSVERGQAVICVEDNGQGIAASDIPKLFQRFNRLHADESSHIPGTGLGLYLTRNIIELHGGRITVESREGRGTAFTIRLPLR